VTHGVLSVPRIIELDESEAGRLAGDPDALQLPDLAKRILNFSFVDLRVQVSNVHFAIARHTCDLIYFTGITKEFYNLFSKEERINSFYLFSL